METPHSSTPPEPLLSDTAFSHFSSCFANQAADVRFKDGAPREEFMVPRCRGLAWFICGSQARTASVDCEVDKAPNLLCLSTAERIKEEERYSPCCCAVLSSSAAEQSEEGTPDEVSWRSKGKNSLESAFVNDLYFVKVFPSHALKGESYRDSKGDW
ncbi:hypothetical protein AOLI_G00140950 [Acnodon oligacanthus]